MARFIGVKTGAQCPIHDRVAKLWLAAKEVQPLEPQAHTCPHQPQKKGQGLEMLHHFSSIASKASVFVQLHLCLGLGPRCCQVLMAATESVQMKQPQPLLPFPVCPWVWEGESFPLN